MRMTNWLLRRERSPQDTSLYVRTKSKDTEAIKLIKPRATTARSHGWMCGGSTKEAESASSGFSMTIVGGG
jgi:hypothetical protein